MRDQAIEVEACGSHLHFIDEGTGNVIWSRGGKIWGVLDGRRFAVDVSKWWLQLFSRNRAFGRLFRIHRINVLRISKEKILIVYNNAVLIYELSAKKITQTYRFPLTRYVHTQSVSTHEAQIVIGEYGNVGAFKSVGAIISLDDGATWNYKSLFEKGRVKNVLAIRYDEVDQNYWVFTGDSGDESGIYLFDNTFNLQKRLGRGLAFRAISSFHLSDKVVWLANNPFGVSNVHVYDRASEKISLGAALPGPVWYSCRVGDRVYCCTAAEDVAGEAGKRVYVLHSEDYLQWEVLCEFKKDKMNKRLFLYGLGTFPQAPDTNSRAYLNMDAVDVFDGCVVKLPRPVSHAAGSESL